MKKITDRGRKILSRFFRVISVTAASLILQACYGMMMPEEPMGGAYGMPSPEITIRGKVSANKTEKPIPGIKVSIEETSYYKYTDAEGNFYFNIYYQPQGVYKLKFEDVDGPDNGGQFKEKIQTIKKDDIDDSFLLIGMDSDS
jgi:putative lipoprotein (rSAM/lipoprotein system)